jgi:hypothetical protein
MNEVAFVLYQRLKDLLDDNRYLCTSIDTFYNHKVFKILLTASEIQILISLLRSEVE